MLSEYFRFQTIIVLIVQALPGPRSLIAPTYYSLCYFHNKVIFLLSAKEKKLSYSSPKNITKKMFVSFKKVFFFSFLFNFYWDRYEETI